MNKLKNDIKYINDNLSNVETIQFCALTEENPPVLHDPPHDLKINYRNRVSFFYEGKHHQYSVKNVFFSNTYVTKESNDTKIIMRVCNIYTPLNHPFEVVDMSQIIVEGFIQTSNANDKYYSNTYGMITGISSDDLVGAEEDPDNYVQLSVISTESGSYFQCLLLTGYYGEYTGKLKGENVRFICIGRALIYNFKPVTTGLYLPVKIKLDHEKPKLYNPLYVKLYDRKFSLV